MLQNKFLPVFKGCDTIKVTVNKILSKISQDKTHVRLVFTTVLYSDRHRFTAQWLLDLSAIDMFLLTYKQTDNHLLIA